MRGFSIEQGRQCRVMVYSQDGLGLGHLRRTSNITGQLTALLPSATVLTCMDSPAGPFFAREPRHDYLKLPSVVKEGPGQWRANSLATDYARIHRLRAETLRAAVDEFEPHLLLVDHMPHGSQGELLPALRTIRARRLDTRIVLGVRDILDAPDTVARTWDTEGAGRALAEYYDHVLIYGVGEVFDTASVYGLDRWVGDRITYCGYVSALQPAARPPARRSKPWEIFAMVGGGADGFPAIEAAIEAQRELNRVRPTRLVVTTGPFMPDALHSATLEAASGQDVEVLRSVPDVAPYLQRFDAVVAMAGYNSTAEILASGIPTVLIPRRGPSAEQRMRATAFAEAGWVRAIDPDALTSTLLAGELLHTLARPASSPKVPAEFLNGRLRAAERLASMLRSPARCLVPAIAAAG